MDEFGREDLAVVSYHMGIGNLQQVLGAYGDSDASYPQLYFDASPDRHPRAYRLLAGLGDDSKTYFWRVLASREVMRLYREDRAKLERLAELQSGVGLGRARAPPARPHQELREPGGHRRRDGGRRAASRGGRRAPPGGVRAAGVHPRRRAERVRGEGAADRDEDRAPRTRASHATGYAFDISRTYANGRQAEAFQFMLDRLQALNLIAWTRDARTIHITASSEGRRILGETGR